MIYSTKWKDQSWKFRPLSAGLLMVAGLLSSDAFANRFGITGSSGKEGLDCTRSGCHSGSSFSPSLDYSGDNTFTPGSVNDIELILSFSPPSSVTSPGAGINIAVSDNGGDLTAGFGMQKISSQLTHNGVFSSTNDEVSFSFQWQAPDTEGDVTLYACSQPVNNDFLNSGDSSSAACIEQVFTVADETTEPEPTDPEPTDPSSFVAYDYDGDMLADVGVRRPSNFFQYISNSSDGTTQRVEFGKNTGDIPVSGDFDGDGIADVAVRRPSNYFWFIKNSSDGELQRIEFGKNENDIPVPADYDGDGITDVAVRRASNQFWYILNSSDGEIQRINFGKQEEDIPVPADYDGDGIDDVAVRRPSNFTWYIRRSSDGETEAITFGRNVDDIPVPADYDGDGKADVAVRRASNQFFYILNSSDGETQRINFGKQEEDIPIIADYDGDGKADIAVRRPSTQFQFISRSSDGLLERIHFGKQSNDIPLAAPVLIRMQMVTDANTAGKASNTAPNFEPDAEMDFVHDEHD